MMTRQSKACCCADQQAALFKGTALDGLAEAAAVRGAVKNMWQFQTDDAIAQLSDRVVAIQTTDQQPLVTIAMSLRDTVEHMKAGDLQAGMPSSRTCLRWAVAMQSCAYHASGKCWPSLLADIVVDLGVLVRAIAAHTSLQRLHAEQ